MQSWIAKYIRAAGAATVIGITACAELLQEPRAVDSELPVFALLGSAFTDDFSFFDESRWVRSSHSLGRGPLLPSNVQQGNGIVSLVTRADGYSGAEIMSRDLYGAGTFTIRARCAVPLGAICAFFLYETGSRDRADEIDIEIIPASGQIAFTVWRNGRLTFTTSHALAFNPADGFHTYSFQRSANTVRFFVDGALMQTFQSKNKLPQTAMPVFANAWWPTWLSPVGDTGAWEIDYITVS